MENLIKWGVIGSGGIARRRTIPEGITKSNHAQLISVYDINRAVNEDVAREFNVKSAESIDELAERMNSLNGNQIVQPALLRKTINNYDQQIKRGPKYFNDDHRNSGYRKAMKE